MATGRLAFILGTRGPAVTVNAACSSSMVALHLGIGGMKRGETDIVICGGVNLILAPETSIRHSAAALQSVSISLSSLPPLATDSTTLAYLRASSLNAPSLFAESRRRTFFVVVV